MNVIAQKNIWQKHFATLDKNVLKEMIEEDGKAELVCHFCNKNMNFLKKN